MKNRFLVEYGEREGSSIRGKTKPRKKRGGREWKGSRESHGVYDESHERPEILLPNIFVRLNAWNSVVHGFCEGGRM